MKAGIILPPEASINWIIQDQYLLNILNRYEFALMDIDDYNRYQKFASKSKTSLIKAFLLKLLTSINFLKIIDYTNYFSNHDCATVFLRARTLTNTLFSVDKKRDIVYKYAADGYEGYISYARSDLRESIYDILDPAEKPEFQESRKKAKDQLGQIEKKTFSEEKLRSYWHRLYSKILTSYIIAKRVNKQNNKIHVKVFDSLEYQIVEESIGFLRFHDFNDISLFSDISEQKNFQPIGEQIYRATEDVKISNKDFPVILPLLISFILNKENITSKLFEEIHNLPQRKIIEEAKEIHREFTSGMLQKTNEKGIFYMILGFLNSAFSYVSAIDTIKGTISTVQSIEESEKSNLSKLIALAIILDEPYTSKFRFPKFKLDYNYWLTYLNAVFTKRNNHDLSWIDSQRNMGDWTDSSVYVPWYENFHSSRYREDKRFKMLIY